LTSDLIPIIALILASLGLLWICIPWVAGIPWVPSSPRRIQKAFELAELKPGEKFYDLGCGDGRVVIAAAKQWGADAVGIEISPLHCLLAWLRVRSASLQSHVKIRWGNFYRLDLGDADLVYQYGHSRFAAELGGQLAAQMRPGTRFVSINVDIPGWQPQAFDQELKIFVYQFPPTPGSLADFLMQGDT
jgi:SAM-dependent methyltransferase